MIMYKLTINNIRMIALPMAHLMSKQERLAMKWMKKLNKTKQKEIDNFFSFAKVIRTYK